jgi:hypothetical protein
MPRLAEAGGFPGLQVLNTDELRTVLAELKARKAAIVIDRMWFCPHPYGLNHPPDYPFDKRNRYDHPGATLLTDDRAVLQFLEFSPIFEKELGFVPPFVAGEGGWQYRNAEDGRYAKIDDGTHAHYHAALFDWFRTGLLSNGDSLPDYLFAFCPWILFGNEADAWYSRTTGTRQGTIDAVKSVPKFARKFRRTGLPQQKTWPDRVLSHYLLMGAPTSSQRSRLLLARDYITRFNVSFGFSVAEAAHAVDVTILGDRGLVSDESESELKKSGCRVERLLGDAYALRTILEDRIARSEEFG